MITLNGREYPTIADAARDFKVSAKTVRDWIEKGILQPPPEVEQGLRQIAVFPADYMKRAHADLDRYRKQRQARQGRSKG